MNSKEINAAYIGSEQVDKIYLGQDLVWTNTPDYWAMPLTFNVISGGTITFRKYASGAYTADTCAFVPSLNGVNIAPYNPGVGSNAWVTDTTTSFTVNVQAGDVFTIYGIPQNGFQNLGKGNNHDGGRTSYHTFSGSTAVMSVSGNLMSMCVHPRDIQIHNFTTFKDAADWAMASNLNYVVTSLFRGMPGLVDAENLWMPLDCPAFCYLNLFKGDGLVTAPALPATTAATWSYASMFESTAITTAPELPAITLADYCYYHMFYGCSSLNYIKCLATDISAKYSTNTWVQNVAANGTFVKAASMSSWTTGTSGIPSGWTVQDA